MSFIWKLGWLRGFSILRERGRFRLSPFRLQRKEDAFFLQRLS